ncbi:50S ribosomal protein L21 [Sinomicrobium soli]|uniref:50S ribosomal protein L21 n=1 Tax=Sinomicrobium sp. N-1-3-6 TaxID=2219864 RepID=UPI000DCE1F82|nr:50S ribosomal protein L21 [Sinomicrobium sp. N-1-3-6]RAV28125.1 50S ribosomal protein L21 [Sinomicrobium sp. N-1-3-6]
MYAIVEIAGQQFKVAKDQKVFVHRLAEDEGSKVSFDNVLLVDNGGDVTIGAPAIDGASVEAKVVKHLKGDKVIVFKKKRRKGYRVKNGHRQFLTEIVVEDILASGAKKQAPKAKAEKPAKKAAAKKTAKKGDDLKKIEGIGPKIAELFNSNGIVTYTDLAATAVDKLRDILTEAGPNYANKVPDTWPQQAQLAADGKWDELKDLQEKLDGGIEK